jgi:hypothetical protein
MAAVNWQKFQASGADFALESAVGVLIYQMGLAAATIFAVIVLLIKEAPFGKNSANPRDIIILGLATVAVNGIFQEEAYTSYSCGMFALFSAIIVANGYRTTITQANATARSLTRILSGRAGHEMGFGQPS